MTPTPVRAPRHPRRGAWTGAPGRLAVRAVLAVLLAATGVLLSAGQASAHVVPSTVVQLDLHSDRIDGDVVLPAGDLASASGLPLVDAAGAAVPIDTATSVAVAEYLSDHVAVTSAAGGWTVAFTDVTATATEQYGTGAFPAVTAGLVLTPPTGADVHRFDLTWNAIVHQVVTADTYVVLRSDDAPITGTPLPTSLGVVATDTVTGSVPVLQVDLSGGDTGRTSTGVIGMVTLGMSHIAEGTDHQLFLLTLLLPAPLVAAAGRWHGAVPGRRAVRRITSTTLAFTLGHSITLALGALGLPVPGRAVEAAIALSILVASVHAIRPLFPGREPLVAAGFGLVHGLAFAGTLAELDLSGGELVRSLLGFNTGIELMQLAVVVLVLPPLVVLARTPLYPRLRASVATLTGIAASGWLLDRIGVSTPLASAADALRPASPWICAALWALAAAALIRARRNPDRVAPRSTAIPLVGAE